LVRVLEHIEQIAPLDVEHDFFEANTALSPELLGVPPAFDMYLTTYGADVILWL